MSHIILPPAVTIKATYTCLILSFRAVNEVTKCDEPRYFSYPLIKKDSLEFRLYQDTVFKSVRNKNALVILPTSLGKTVIAILLCAEFLYKYKSKRVLIMAPTKPLVSQHMSSFFSLLRIPKDVVAMVSGTRLKVD